MGIHGEAADVTLLCSFRRGCLSQAHRLQHHIQVLKGPGRFIKPVTARPRTQGFRIRFPIKGV